VIIASVLVVCDEAKDPEFPDDREGDKFRRGRKIAASVSSTGYAACGTEKQRAAKKARHRID